MSPHHTSLVLDLPLDLGRGLDDEVHGGGVLAQLVGGRDLVLARVRLRHVLYHQRHRLLVLVQEPTENQCVVSFL